MAMPSISDLTLFKSRHLQISEKITTYLSHLEALMDVVLSINFFELSKPTMHVYFSIVADLIEDISRLSRTNTVLLQAL